MNHIRAFTVLPLAILALTAGILSLPAPTRAQLAEALEHLTAGPAYVRHQETAAQVSLPSTPSSRE